MRRVGLTLLLVGILMVQALGMAPEPASVPTAYPPTAYATQCNGPDDFGYTCTNVTRPYIDAGTTEPDGSDGSNPVTGVHCDSGCQLLFVQLPFTFSYYGQPFTQYNVISDGNIQFNSSTDLTPIDPLLVNGIHSGIFPFWNDLCTDDDCSGGAGATLGNGVFVTTVGTAPNRLYVIEWRAHPTDIFPGPGNIPTPPNTFFELQL